MLLVGAIAAVLAFVAAVAFAAANTSPPRGIVDPSIVDISGRALVMFPFVLLAARVVRTRRNRSIWLLCALLWLPLATGSQILAAMWLELPGTTPSVTTPDGAAFRLGVGPAMTDVVYSLWRRAPGIAPIWREVLPSTDLTYSEDGRFTRGARLVVAQEGRMLLIERGGLFTDCVDTLRAQACAGIGPHTGVADDDENWRRRSAAIKDAAGLAEVR
jgi:hypothetical protein